jgi:ELWxxDGT repeat protein
VAAARVFFTVPEGGAESLWVTGDAGATRTGIVLAEGASAIAYGTRLLFAGMGDHGIEPWQTDGTLQGTSQLADLAAGAADSQPAAFAVVGAAATFFSSSAATGITLWRTDGSAVGTTEVTAWPTDGATRGAAGYARRLYFRARMSGAAWAMWSSDGTKAGTAALALLDDDMLDGPMLGAGASFFFSGRYRGGAALFATGGTAASTVAVVAHGVDALTALGDRVYFPIDDTHLGGTNGTTAGTGILELPADVGHVEGAAGIFAVAAQNLYFTSMGEDGDVRLWALPLPTQTAPVLDAGAPTVADAGVTEDAAATEEDDGCSCKNNKLLSPFLGLFMFAFAKRRNKN